LAVAGGGKSRLCFGVWRCLNLIPKMSFVGAEKVSKNPVLHTIGTSFLSFTSSWKKGRKFFFCFCSSLPYMSSVVAVIRMNLLPA
jgi:hypothetical protein